MNGRTHDLNSLCRPRGDRLACEPDAGNLHVRFDEGEQSASGSTALYSTVLRG